MLYGEKKNESIMYTRVYINLKNRQKCCVFITGGFFSEGERGGS